MTKHYLGRDGLKSDEMANSYYWDDERLELTKEWRERVTLLPLPFVTKSELQELMFFLMRDYGNPEAKARARAIHHLVGNINKKACGIIYTPPDNGIAESE